MGGLFPSPASMINNPCASISRDTLGSSPGGGPWPVEEVSRVQVVM